MSGDLRTRSALSLMADGLVSTDDPAGHLHAIGDARGDVPLDTDVGSASLTSTSARHDLAAIVGFIRNPQAPMPDLHPGPSGDAEVTGIAGYVRTLPGARPR
jgi:hypothetical protein